jgi:hypothetical protein
MFVLAPLSILYLVSYYVINKNKSDRVNTDSTTHKDVAYREIQDTDKDSGSEEKDDGRPDKSPQRRSRENEYLTRKEKMLAIAKLFALTVVPTFIIFVTQYILTQSVVTTIAYKNAPFRPRDHYQYYTFTFMFGELIGRSNRSLISLVHPRWLYAPTCKLIWLLSIIEILLMFIVLFESWYRFLPSVAIVLVLCLLSGTIVGLFYNNMFVLIHVTFEGKQRAFVMGYATFPLTLTAGMFVAGLVGLYVEPRLLEHCISTVTESAYCFTRSATLKDIILRCRA